MKRLIFILLLSTAMMGQVTSWTARRIQNGATLPAHCAPGDVFFKNTAAIGQYNCTATDTWTAMGVAGGSTAFGAITSGSNTGAAMVVDTGASLTYSNSGTINASTLRGKTFGVPPIIGDGIANTVLASAVTGTAINPSPGPLLTVTNGAAGHYTYGVCSLDNNGFCAPSATTATTVGPTALNGTDFIDVGAWTNVGATTCVIYRIAGGATQGIIGSVTCGNNLVDNGLVGGGETFPVANFSGSGSFSRILSPAFSASHLVGVNGANTLADIPNSDVDFVTGHVGIEADSRADDAVGVVGASVTATYFGNGDTDLMEAVSVNVGNSSSHNITQVIGIDLTAGGTSEGGGTANDVVALSADAHGGTDSDTGIRVIPITGISTTSATGVEVGDITAGTTNYAIKTGLGQVSIGDMTILPALSSGDLSNTDLAGQLTLSSGTQTQASTYLYTSPRICVVSSTAATPLAAQVANAVASTGAIKTTTLNAGGTGYVVGDVGTIDGGTGATYRVLFVSGSAVNTYLITNPGTAGYSVAAAVTTTATSGAGTGFKIDITVIKAIDTLTVTVPGGINGDTYNYICVGRD